MKVGNIIVALLLMVTSLSAAPDRLLGDKFDAQTIELESDYSGEVRATLISRVPIINSDKALLYIHGYNDYFFQEQMAEHFREWGYNFYAIDLRKYGRSYDSSQTMFEVRDLREYFEEIDRVVEQIRGDGARELVLMGHSTGGLIVSYYCGIQQNMPPVDGLILNSPFLDMNLSPFLKSIIPAVAFVGRFMPNLEIPQPSSSAYFESLHRDYHGEWEFDPTLKPMFSPPITAGWIGAIHEAHKSVQSGYDLQIPILLMYSSLSINEAEWSPAHQLADGVLDVADIAKYGSKLGSRVTHAEIKNGMHDLILSGKEARGQAYDEILRWLNANFE